MIPLGKLLARTAVAICLLSSLARAGTLSLNGQAQGPSPFIAILNVTAGGTAALSYIDFKVYPKPGSLTRPVYARYSAAYIQSRGYINQSTGQINLPVFGLYSNYNNTVALVAGFSDNSTKRLVVNVQTPTWTDPLNTFQTPIVTQPRSSQAQLSYDFILLKNISSPNTPIIIDTDGQVRWAGTAGIDYHRYRRTSALGGDRGNRHAIRPLLPERDLHLEWKFRDDSHGIGWLL